MRSKTVILLVFAGEIAPFLNVSSNIIVCDQQEFAFLAFMSGKLPVVCS